MKNITSESRNKCVNLPPNVQNMDTIIYEVAKRTGLPEKGVRAVASLLDEGASVPFISRYRKEATGALDEVAVRTIETTLRSVRELEARKDFVRNAIDEAGGLTAALESKLSQASTMTEVEDLYAPFRNKNLQVYGETGRASVEARPVCVKCGTYGCS